MRHPRYVQFLIGQRPAAYSALRRYWNHRLTVTAESHGLDLHDGGFCCLSDEVREARGVEHAGLAHYSSPVQTGDLCCQGGHVIERVGHHDEDRIGRVLHHLLSHTLDDLGVDLEEVHS